MKTKSEKKKVKKENNIYIKNKIKKLYKKSIYITQCP